MWFGPSRREVAGQCWAKQGNFLNKEKYLETLNRYRIHLKSVSPLIMNCDRLANPLDPKTKEIKQLTGLKKKQDIHYMAIAKLQWEASLYYNDEIGIHIPSKNIQACIKASARKERKGLQTKGVIIDAFPGTALIGYEKMTPEKLWAVENNKKEQVHVYTCSVVVQRAKQMRSRPIFPSWALKFEVLLNIELLPETDFVTILERAGYEYGLCELRPELATGSCGRFKVEEVKKL